MKMAKKRELRAKKKQEQDIIKDKDNTSSASKSNLNINWFPGHMAKARREISERLSLCDIVIELRDARIPLSSKNPMVDDIVGKKPRLIILNKANMADKKVTAQWINTLNDETTIALDIDCIDNYNIKKIVPCMREVLKDKIESQISKGIIANNIKALVIGIPNVGKSTFINNLAKRKAVKVGDRPGVTKGQTWIKINEELQIMDTPGILWPKFEDKQVGINLAICGSIKDEILDLEAITHEALTYLIANYKPYLCARYDLLIDDLDDLDTEGVLTLIAKKRGALSKGGFIDYQRIYTVIINDIRTNRIGDVSFERPNL